MRRRHHALAWLGGILLLSTMCTTAPAHAEDPLARNHIRGSISVPNGIALTNGDISVHQGFGRPDVIAGIGTLIFHTVPFGIDGWGPVIDAKWQIQDGDTSTDFWVDAKLTTSAIGPATASCQIVKGRPGQKESQPKPATSGYSCSWDNYSKAGENNTIRPQLKVEKFGIQEVNDPDTQDAILRQFCTDSSKCRYVSESFDDKVIDTEKIVGTPVANTTSFMVTPQYTWTHTVSWSDTAGGKVTGAVKVNPDVLKIVEATLSVELNYAHTWGNSRSFSETIPLPIAPHSIGYLTHQPILVTTTGHFIVDTGDGVLKKITNRSFSAPRQAPDMNDPSYGNWIFGQLTTYNCPLDQWNHGANSCRHPAPS